MERIASLIIHNLFILIPSVLYNKMNLILETQQKQYSLFTGYSFHIHIIHFQYFIPWLQSLCECWTPWLYSSDKYTNFIATCQSNTYRSLFLECNKSWIGPNKIKIYLNTPVNRLVIILFDNLL